MKTTISTLLKQKRKEKGWSVKSVSEKLKTLGVSAAEKTIYGWESGQRQPDADTFVVLCRLYGITSFDEMESAPAITAETLDEDDLVILEYFHTLSQDQKQFLLAVLQVLSEQTRPEPSSPPAGADAEA